jgi:subtilisin family serine protease
MLQRVSALLVVLSSVPTSGYPQGTEIIEGVPIYNYDLARLARVGRSPANQLALYEMMSKPGANKPHKKDIDDIEWIIVMNDNVTDKQVDDLCHDRAAHGCLSEGHPDEKGIPITGVKATVAGLTKLLRNHTGEVKHIEPNLPIYLPPGEAHFEKDHRKGKGAALLESFDEADYGGRYYVMQQIADGFVTGKQYSKLAGATDEYTKWDKTGSPVIIVGDDFQTIKSNGITSDTIVADYAEWWSQHTGKKANIGNLKPTDAPTTKEPEFGRRRRSSSTPRPTPRKKSSDTKAASPSEVRRRRSKKPDFSPGKPDYRWGLDRVDDRKGFDKSYDFAYDGHGVHVYVLDTGIKLDHMDFWTDDGGSRAIPTIEMWGTEVMECSGPKDATCAIDRFGHGTHCAGSVAGETSGVAKGATIHAVKVLGDDGKGSDLGLAMAVDWIMTKGERPAILSMSLGRRGKSPTMEDVVKKAIKSGLTVVVAAGNENLDACGNSPAYIDGAITVGATTEDDARADFSNYGSCVDIFAPGKSIKSAYYAGAARYATMSGTSMACPHVSGFAAMLLQANPKLTPAEVKALILKEATPNMMTGIGSRSPDLMLYVSPNPSWGASAKSGSKSGRSAKKPDVGPRGRRRRRRRRSRGKKSSKKTSRRRRRRRRRRSTTTAAPAGM